MYFPSHWASLGVTVARHHQAPTFAMLLAQFFGLSPSPYNILRFLYLTMPSILAVVCLIHYFQMALGKSQISLSLFTLCLIWTHQDSDLELPSLFTINLLGFRWTWSRLRISWTWIHEVLVRVSSDSIKIFVVLFGLMQCMFDLDPPSTCIFQCVGLGPTKSTIQTWLGPTKSLYHRLPICFSMS